MKTSNIFVTAISRCPEKLPKSRILFLGLKYISNLQARPINFYRAGKNPKKSYFLKGPNRVGKQALGWDFPQSPHPYGRTCIYFELR